MQTPGSEVTSCLPLSCLVPMEDTGVVTTMDGESKNPADCCFVVAPGTGDVVTQLSSCYIHLLSERGLRLQELVRIPEDRFSSALDALN